MVLYKTRKTKALIRLRGCAGWSAPVLFANPEDRFSRVEAQFVSNDNTLFNAIMQKENVCANVDWSGGRGTPIPGKAYM